MYKTIIPKDFGFVKGDFPLTVELPDNPDQKPPKELKIKGRSRHRFNEHDLFHPVKVDKKTGELIAKPKSNTILAWEQHKAESARIASRFYAIHHILKAEAQLARASGDHSTADRIALDATKFYERGQRMYNCASFLQHGKCPDCGRAHTSSAILCRDRVCPTCNWRLSLQQAVEMQNTLALINDIDQYKAAFFCVTIKNCQPADLKGTLERMSEAWNRLLNRKKPKRDFKGWARRVEITYNRDTRTFHPHYHVILLVPAKHPDSLYDMAAMICEYWRSALRLDYDPVTDFEWIEDLTAGGLDENAAPNLHKAILETFKYTIKDNELSEMPLDLFRQFVEQIQNKRLTAYGGIIKEARAQLEYSDELDQEPQLSCGKCASPLLNRVIYRWSFASNTYERFENIMISEGHKGA